MAVLSSHHTQVARAMSESELQSNVIALAKSLGYLVHAERPAMKRDGTWRTPVQGDKGFPDLVLARRDKLIFLELKRQGAWPTDAQLEWLNSAAPRMGAHLRVQGLIGRPSDWLDGTIERVLRGQE